MKDSVVKGTTGHSTNVFIGDSTVSTGAGKTGLAYNSAGLKAYYVRTRSAAVQITLATQTVNGAWSSGGFVEVDATNCPGLYRIDIPDAALATGADEVVVMLSGATGMVPTPLKLALTGVDSQDATAFGLSRIDAAITSRLAPTTAGRTLDVSTGGEAGVDWANIGSPTTSNALSGTTISTSQVAASVTAGVTVTTNNDKSGYSLSSAGIQALWDALTSALTTSGSIGKLLVDNINATISSRSTYAGGDTSGTTTLLSRITSGRAANMDNLDAAITSRSSFVAASESVTVGTNNDKSGYSLSSAGIQGIWDKLTSALTTSGSIGKLLVDNINATISSRLASASYTTPPTANENADALLDRTDGIESGYTPRKSLRLMLSALAGLLSGAGTTTVSIRDIGNTKNRIIATVDLDGNRSAITYDAT